MKYKMKGFTLLELMMSLIILTILLSISFVGWRHFVIASQLETMVTQLTSAIHYARASAMLNHTPVVFCGSEDGNSCDKHWNNGLIIKWVDSGMLLRKIALLAVDCRLLWKSSLGTNQYLKFFADGGTGQLGSFYCCPPEGSLNYAQEIIVNRSGRLKIIKGNFKACEEN